MGFLLSGYIMDFLIWEADVRWTWSVWEVSHLWVFGSTLSFFWFFMISHLLSITPMIAW